MATRLEELRKNMIAERQRLKDELALTWRHSPVGDQEPDASKKTEGAAAGATELMLRGAMSKRAVVQLAEVERALEKLDDGTYGLCDNCGKNIPAERLNAVPHTTMCVDCKTKQTKQSAITAR